MGKKVGDGGAERSPARLEEAIPPAKRYLI